MNNWKETMLGEVAEFSNGAGGLRRDGNLLRQVCGKDLADTRPDDSGGAKRCAERRRREYGVGDIEEDGTEADGSGAGQLGRAAAGL